MKLRSVSLIALTMMATAVAGLATASALPADPPGGVHAPNGLAGLNFNFQTFSDSPIPAAPPEGQTTRRSAGYCGSILNTAVDFDWGEGPGPAACGVDRFRGFASGRIIAPFTGTVDFCSITDDGFYLTVNDQVVIDDWNEQGAFECNGSGSFSMQQGRSYAVKMWFFENEGRASLRLSWRYDGGGWITVPRVAFRPS